jgi:hypothetical protein
MWILAVLLAAACASAGPTPQASSAAAQAPTASPTYEDARSNASDAEIRDARRAYRAACQQTQSDGFCECMTGGMAQALAPADLAIATAALEGRSVPASAQARARVELARGQVEPGCASFRR